MLTNCAVDWSQYLYDDVITTVRLVAVAVAVAVALAIAIAIRNWQTRDITYS